MIQPFHRWDHTVVQDATLTVMPDGCRDILVIAAPNGPPETRVTEVDMHPRRIRLRRGTQIAGYRLGPGTVIDGDALADNAEPLDLIDRRTEEVMEIVAELSVQAADIPQVAKSTGVSVRTLQRRFRSLGLPAPEFWRLLGRARRAAASLDADLRLSDIAHDHHYADQAHMTREFMRWFGHTPATLRDNRALLEDLCQPGLGNWTGEQISIR